MNRSLVFLPLVILMAFTLGCQDQQALAELEGMKAQAAVEEQNRELVLSFFEAWGNGDFDALDDFCSPDLRFYFPSNNPDPMSLEELKAFATVYRKAIHNINWTMEELIVSGDKVVMRFIERGTHEGEFMGIPASGNRYEASGIGISRIEDGRIVEQWEDFDMLGFMQQLGMELRPAAVEE
jgi:steroid delta-isomerase-like uncharacterized protein